MKIEARLHSYRILSGAPVRDALELMNKNKARIVFIVKPDETLIGTLSDGDFRRHAARSGGADLNITVDEIMNREYLSAPMDCDKASLSRHFLSRDGAVPLVDHDGRLCRVALKGSWDLKIEGTTVSRDGSTFVIAEIGNNHNGSLELAYKLVDKAAEAGANCAKFQMRDLEALYVNTFHEGRNALGLGTEYTLDLLKKFQLPVNDLFKVFDYCRVRGIMPLCTPWDIESLKNLEQYGMGAYKVASADLTNTGFLKALAETRKPLICSTGMSAEEEITELISNLSSYAADFAILHCNSTYPTPMKDVNLNYIQRLKSMYPGVIGYSGHERGYVVAASAVALGARIIEKHLTIDRRMEGVDHKVSLLPGEFGAMVSSIRNIEQALGEGAVRKITQGELINRENLAKSLVAATQIEKGTVIDQTMVSAKSPGEGMQPNKMSQLIGKVAKREFRKGDYFYDSDLNSGGTIRKSFRFNRRFGVPVRFHDYATLVENSNMDLVEFHLSYRDLEVQPGSVLQKVQGVEFAVHCPELFEGDHILNLASEDEAYRLRSMMHLESCVKMSEDLLEFFPKTEKPVFVLNAGGWSVDQFISEEKKVERYEILRGSLSEVSLEGVRLALQTMPPFPWHLGGQRYHNLFVAPWEIKDFALRTNFGICLDISHAMMACNFYSWSFEEYLKTVLPHTVHLHIVDASGFDGEGVTTGHGDVNFESLKELLQAYAPDVSFVPEVWQGHKNSGAGFFEALEFLEAKGF